MKLIVGLGNPGKTYAHSRHNIGFRCLNHLARVHSITIKQHQCQSRVGTGKIAGTEVVLAKPQTFVNNSGKAVGSLMQHHHISPADLIVIYDDLDLPLGKIRLRYGGSSGGHKGMQSIISALDSQEFSRIRVGIGRPTRGGGQPTTEEEFIVDYVLSDFTSAEEKLIKSAIVQVAEAVQYILAEGIEIAMNRFNRVKFDIMDER